MLEGFGGDVARVLAALRALERKEARLIFHDDADGVSSAAITKRALEREGFAIEALCLEKVYDEVIRSIHGRSGQTIFYCDIGSSHADLISRHNGRRNLTVILDHHDPVPSTDPMVVDLNLENYGLRGETDFSGATCCYVFAKALSEANAGLSYLALTGSCEIPGGPRGLNRAVLDEALRSGVVETSGKGVLIRRLGMTTRQLFSSLQVLACVGYYKGGPQMGIELALRGMTDEIRAMINELEGRRKAANARLIRLLYRRRLRQTEHVQWFADEGVYAGMGTKVIGTFCSLLSFRKRLINPMKYVIGMMDVPREVPGYGLLSKGFVKVSVRVPRPMQRLIDSRRLPSAVHLLREATRGFGMADGHAYAASAIVDSGCVDEFIANLEPVIAEYGKRAG